MIRKEWLALISPQIHVIWRGRWEPGTVEPARILYDHELIMVNRGRCSMEVGQELLELESGDFVIVPPGVLHSSHCDESVYRSCIHFDWLPASRGRHPVCCYHPRKPRKDLIIPAPEFLPKGILRGRFAADAPALIETLFHRWHAEKLMARPVLLELLTLLFHQPETRMQGKAERETQIAYTVKDLLEAQGEETESIQNLLASTGRSYAHLCRIFRKVFGTTPVDYRNALRLEKAKTLLRDPRHTVTEVAEACGFSDPGYFARKFRQQNGVSPSQYR